MASPLNTNLWLVELIGDEDQAFLSDGICNGFTLAPVDCNYEPAHQGNYKSATCAEQKLAVEETILGAIAEGNYVITDVKPPIVSALGAIPKPDSSEVRQFMIAPVLLVMLSTTTSLANPLSFKLWMMR